MTTTRDELRKLAENATPGPWEADHSEEDNSAIRAPGAGWGEGYAYVSRAADAEFIATARTALPVLLDQLDAAEARIKAVREVHRPVGLTAHTGPRIHPGGDPIPDDTPVCEHCTDPDALGWVSYPCPTIRALNGEA